MEKRNGANYKVKLMCSYGGKIQPRSHDRRRLTYYGGDTKILTVNRRIKFADIVAKLTSLCNAVAPVSLKYQLPGEDLDALVSVINGDDLEHMMDEYDRVCILSSKPARIRLFLFPPNPPPKSAPLNPDFLFGFDDEYDYQTTQTNPTPTQEISRVVDTVEPFISGSGVCNGALVEETKGQTFSCDSHVAIGGHAGGELVYYRVPVTTCGYEYGAVVPAIIHREQPVCNFVPMIPSAQDQKLGYNSSHPTLMMASTFF